MSEGGATPGGQEPPRQPPYGSPPQRPRGDEQGRPRGPMPPWQHQPVAPPPPPPPRPRQVTRPALPDWGQGPSYGEQPPAPPPPPPAGSDPWGQDEPGSEPPRWGAEEPPIGGPQWNWQPSLEYTYTPRRPRRKGLLIGLAGGGGAVLVVIVVLLVWLFTRGGQQPDVGYRVAWQVPGDGRAPVDAYVAGALAVRADTLGVTAYDVASGKQKWHVAMPTGQQLCTVTPNAPGNVLAFVHGVGASNCTTVTAVDATTGKTMWQANPPTRSGVKPAAAGAAVLQNKVVVSNGYRVLAYDVRSGKPIWNIGPANPQCGPGDLMANGSVLIALVNCSPKNVSKGDDGVYSISPTDGKTVWTAHLPNDHGFAPPRVVNVSPPIVRVEDESGKPQLQVYDDQGKPATTVTVDGGGSLDDRTSLLDVRASLHVRYPFVVANGVLVGMGRSDGGRHGVAVGVGLTDGRRKWERKLATGYDARLLTLQSTPPAGRIPIYEQKPGSVGGFQRLGLLDSATGRLTEGRVVTQQVGSLDRLFYLSGRSVVAMAKNASEKQAITAYAPK